MNASVNIVALAQAVVDAELALEHAKASLFAALGMAVPAQPVAPVVAAKRITAAPVKVVATRRAASKPVQVAAEPARGSVQARLLDYLRGRDIATVDAIATRIYERSDENGRNRASRALYVCKAKGLVESVGKGAWRAVGAREAASGRSGKAAASKAVGDDDDEPEPAPAPARPRVRGDCVDGPRPCPWVSCRHHLAIIRIRCNHTIRLLDDWETKPTCSLDVADEGPHLLDQVGELLECGRSRADQIEVRALANLRAACPELQPHDDPVGPTWQPGPWD